MLRTEFEKLISAYSGQSRRLATVVCRRQHRVRGVQAGPWYLRAPTQHERAQRRRGQERRHPPVRHQPEALQVQRTQIGVASQRAHGGVRELEAHGQVQGVQGGETRRQGSHAWRM